MGNRLRVHIKHEIEYGGGMFNWQIDELRTLLEENGCQVKEQFDEDGCGDWEIEDSTFIEAVKKIKEMDASEIKDHFEDDFVGSSTDEEFKNYVVSSLEGCIAKGDHRDGFYHFSWF